MTFKEHCVMGLYSIVILIAGFSVAWSNLTTANNVEGILQQNPCLCPCKPFEQKEYYVSSNRISDWFGAVAFCNSVGMEIAEVLNEEEANALHQTIQEEDPEEEKEFFWIGANDLGVQGTHRWGLTGRPVTYSNWTDGEPNNALDEDGQQSERCAAIAKDTLRWNDFQCTQRKKFVCQQFREH
ncbi:C-type lectin domain family 4 member M-like [Anopheles marshallii]|uniref:C-type lectin domain family 4 member M-like n=1 Tax=Anopheles marshallii TaxID=1521116 RepID=UPI00237C3B75|nr:C-type lectin domain family 4 member M-like [Anopheles marshallii]